MQAKRLPHTYVHDAKICVRSSTRTSHLEMIHAMSLLIRMPSSKLVVNSSHEGYLRHARTLCYKNACAPPMLYTGSITSSAAAPVMMSTQPILSSISALSLCQLSLGVQVSAARVQSACSFRRRPAWALSRALGALQWHRRSHRRRRTRGRAGELVSARPSSRRSRQVGTPC